jgi:HEAT repeat protein
VLDNNNELELVKLLQTGNRTAQLQAIVKLTRMGKTEETLRVVIPFISLDDRELSFFAEQAATKIAQKLKIDLNHYIRVNEFEPVVENSNLSREMFLRPVPEKVDELLDIIRFEPEKLHKDILPAVGVFLTRYGSSEDADFIKTQLLNDNSNLALPFLAAAESKAKEILPEVLANLLASPENLVRSRAITVLQRIDAIEAERHFADLLGSKNAENRLAGLGVAMLFPFERVREYLITLLTVETDRDVIAACQTVLLSNPELDSVMSVLDKLETVSTEHKNVLSLVFKNICKALVVAKIMSAEEADPAKIVELWKKQRFNNFLRDLELHLSSGDSEQTERIMAWLEANQGHPSVIAFIQRLENNPQTEDVYKRLADKIPALQQQAQPEAQAARAPDQVAGGGKASEDTFQKINEKEIIARLKAVDVETIADSLSWIMELAQDSSEQMANVRAEAIVTLTRESRTIKLIDLAKEAIRASQTQVRVAAFKALERTDPEFLKENLQDLLREEDGRLRVRVIRFAVKHDPKKAIQESRKLLKSDDLTLRTNAISCLGLCPFEAVARVLLDHLQVEEHPTIAKQVMNIILSNPSASMLDAFDSLEANQNPAVAMIIAQGRNELAESVQKLPQKKEPKKTEADEIFSALTEEKPQKASEKPYSMAKVKAIAKKNEKNAEKKEVNVQLILSAVIVVLMVLGLPFMILKMPKKEPRPPKAQTQKKGAGKNAGVKTGNAKNTIAQTPVPTKFRMNRACSLTGTVEKVLSNTSMIVVHEQTKINVQYTNGMPVKVKEYDRVKMTLVPYKTNAQGIILARGQKLELEE